MASSTWKGFTHFRTTPRHCPGEFEGVDRGQTAGKTMVSEEKPGPAPVIDRMESANPKPAKCGKAEAEESR